MRFGRCAEPAWVFLQPRGASRLAVCCLAFLPGKIAITPQPVGVVLLTTSHPSSSTFFPLCLMQVRYADGSWRPRRQFSSPILGLPAGETSLFRRAQLRIRPGILSPCPSCGSESDPNRRRATCTESRRSIGSMHGSTYRVLRLLVICCDAEHSTEHREHRAQSTGSLVPGCVSGWWLNPLPSSIADVGQQGTRPNLDGLLFAQTGMSNHLFTESYIKPEATVGANRTADGSAAALARLVACPAARSAGSTRVKGGRCIDNLRC